MKRTFGLAGLAATAALSVALVSGIAFAATATTEPKLPSDIATAWKKTGEVTCSKHAGKIFMQQEYEQESDEALQIISIMSLNGQKVSQLEASLLDKGPLMVIYVRNSPDKNWLKYNENEVDQADVRLYAEFGLTKEQLLQACSR